MSSAATHTRKLLASNVRRERLACALSQEALGHAAGLDRTYISGIERGKRNVGVDNIHRIAEALKIEPYELLMNQSPST